jgi:hypothetical protein
MNKEFEAFYNKIKNKLPKGMTNEQFEEVVLYANKKLHEEKKKKVGQGKPESITFNPVVQVNPEQYKGSGAGSDAARSHKIYQKANVKGK